ncbi:MAG TPA: hypothetical protein VIM89_10615 [Mucilaginibacter sp.]
MLRQFITLIIAFFYSAFIYGQVPPIKLKFEKGHVTARFLVQNQERRFTLDSNLPSTATNDTTALVSADSGRIVTKKKITYFDHQCVITSEIKKTGYGLLWDTYIEGLDSDFTIPIETALQWDNPAPLQFWTTWSDNHLNIKSNDWQDPFIPASFQDLKLVYGGESHTSRDAFVIPIASSFFKDGNVGVSFIESLNDTILNLNINTTADGRIAYQHINHRIGKGRKIHIRHQIVFHEADWRAGISWLKDNYKDYFVPEAPEVNSIAGCGAYSSFEGELDTAKYHNMGFSINWKASLDFPYMGLFIPPVKNDDEKWTKYKQGGVIVGDGYASISRLNEYSKHLNKMGFYTLSYFNVYEFGNAIVYPYKISQTVNSNDWENPNDFLYKKLKSAMLKPAGQLPDWEDRPLYSNWEGSVVLDPAVPSYHTLLLNQAELHIEKISASSGICIDRLDWTRYYNGNGDDSISMIGQQKTRSMLTSWKSIITPVAQMMHAAHKAIFCNPLNRRIDLLQHIDGIYDEFGYLPYSLNLCSQMAFFKPIIAWTFSKENLQPDPDAYFQHHIYMGAFLTVPFPGNDHCITPDKWADKYYADYGMLLRALKGREWILSPHVVEVENNAAKANVFKTNAGVIVPVVLGGKTQKASVLLRLPYSVLEKKDLEIKVLYPGEKTWKVLKKVKFSKVIKTEVQLERGCALLCIS